MRFGPSLTARIIAVTRGAAGRPAVATGDANGEDRLVRSLQWPPAFRVPGMTAYVAARTELFDEALLRACEAGVEQVVIAGAGYDGRALRFRKPGVTFFEVDHPRTQADKIERLTSLGVDVRDVRFVPLDLRAGTIADALATAGHDGEKPTHVLCEGLTPYVSETALLQLLRSLAARASPASTLAIDALGPGRGFAFFARTGVRFVRWGTAALGEPMVTLLAPTDVEALLRRAGWTPVETVPIGATFPVTFTLAEVRG